MDLHALDTPRLDALEREFSRRAGAAGANLAAELAWNTALDLLQDARLQAANHRLKTQRIRLRMQEAAATTSHRKLGLRLTR